MVTLSETRLPDAAQLADTLANFVENNSYDPDAVDWEMFERFSARSSARILAEAAATALERAGRS